MRCTQIPEVYLFGPWIGEFAHEFLYWKDWVNAQALLMRGSQIVVSSFPGHHIFYPHCSEFIPHTIQSGILAMSAHGPVVDGFVDGYPGQLSGITNRDKIIKYTRLLKAYLKRRHPGSLVHLKAPFLLSDSDFHPFLVGSDLGYKVAQPLSHTWVKPQMPHRFQLASPSNSVKEHVIFRDLDPSRPSVCIFPRFRSIRRPDKNLSYEFYQDLCKWVLACGDNCLVIGSETGAYSFASFVGKGRLINLIDDITPDLRLKLHTYALSLSKVAIGGLSGGMVYALYNHVPSVVIGNPHQYHQLQ